MCCQESGSSNWHGVVNDFDNILNGFTIIGSGDFT